MAEDYRDWLRASMEQTGVKQAELARLLTERLGRKIDRTQVNKAFNLKRSVQADEARAVAEILRIDLPPGLKPVRELRRVSSFDENWPPADFDPDAGHVVSIGERYVGELPGATPEVDSKAGGGEGTVHPERGVALGSNGIMSGHRVIAEWVFPPAFLQHEVGATASRACVMEVKGDSMEPTLSPGDRIIVDTSHTVLNPDGLYVIDEGLGPRVKRVQVDYDADPVAAHVISDNPSHPPCITAIERIRVIGRVCGRVSRL